MTVLEQAQEYISYWQKQFRMLDWEFTVKIHEDPEKFESFGSMTHSLNNQAAQMDLLDPDKIPSEWVGVRDLEVTIVHELVHARFIYCMKPKKKNKNYHQEMAIETVAKALVANRRGITPEELV